MTDNIVTDIKRAGVHVCHDRDHAEITRLRHRVAELEAVVKHSAGALATTLHGEKNDYKIPLNLSNREIQVIRLIAEGMTMQMVATKLSLSQSTIKTHLQNIYGKMDVHNRTGMIRLAMHLGIVS